MQHGYLISVVALEKTPTSIMDWHPNYAVSRVLGYRLRQGSDDALTVNGAGMDMGFEIAYSLATELYGDGYSLNHRWL